MSLISRYRGFAMFCWICHSLVVMVYCPDSMSGIGGVGCRVIECRVFKTMPPRDKAPAPKTLVPRLSQHPGPKTLAPRLSQHPGPKTLAPRLSQWHQHRGSYNTEALTTPRLSQRHQQHSATRLAPKAYTKAHRRLSSTSFCFSQASIVSVCKMRPHFAK